MAGPAPIASLGRRRGRVASFDHDRGLGTVATDDDAVDGEFPFHCTAIADGSRTIAEGTSVTFEVIAGRQGRWEAWEIAPS